MQTHIHTRRPAWLGAARHITTGLVGLVLAGLVLAGPAHADEPEAPPAVAPTPQDSPAGTEGSADAADAPLGRQTAPLDDLGTLRITAPRIYGGPLQEDDNLNLTALRAERSTFRTPASVSRFTSSDLRSRRTVRSLSHALEGQPGVLVQKTAPLQHSPFIRGWTAYHNLLMIDGIRLNSSAFRSGPNQYWATVDPLSLQNLELARGPYSVLYGSDAVGGTVNALTKRRTRFPNGLHWNGGTYLRYASAEDAVFARGEIEGNYNRLGWHAGLTYKHYGDIRSGGGRLPGTGDIDDWAGDIRFDYQFNRFTELTVLWQRVRQFDAPRTEQTVDSVSFQGTAVGSELQRDHDQARDLVYAKLSYDGGHCCKPFSRGHIAFSYHRQDEERDRLRTNDRRDLSGFTVDQIGVQAQLESPTAWGRFTYGVDFYHDEVSSFREDYQFGVSTGTSVQGPLGDEGTYDLLGVYVQNDMQIGNLNLVAGLRFTYASASADRVDNPAVAGSDPNTPGNIISVDNDWTRLTAGLRATYRVHEYVNLFAGVSQAFRAPTLSDLTALDSTSVVETPSPDLDAEDFLLFELGAKTQSRRWSAEVAGWYTILDDNIIRSPTGALINGTPEVRKDNIGDGWMAGIDFTASYRITGDWTVFGNLSYMDGEVDQLDATDTLVRRSVSRNKPLTWLLALRYEPWRGCFWAQAEWLHSEDADKLSLRDQTDSRRIPPNGTPGWDVFNVRAGYRLNKNADLTLSVENIFDENYRVHGSGQNEPGMNIIVGLDVRF